MPTVLGRYMHQELELDLIILPSFIVWDINLITGTTLNDRPSFFFFNLPSRFIASWHLFQTEEKILCHKLEVTSSF